MEPLRRTDIHLLRVYDYLRTACAFAEEAKGREAFFNDQEVEVDSARTVATRTSRVQTEHLGRVLGFTERPSGRQAYVAVPQHNHAAWHVYSGVLSARSLHTLGAQRITNKYNSQRRVPITVRYVSFGLGLAIPSLGFVGGFPDAQI